MSPGLGRWAGWSLGKPAFDLLERGLAPLAVRHPRPALAAAGALGRLRNRLSRRWPAPEQVRALFPHLGAREAARVAWEIGGLEARNRLLVACIRRAGLAPVRPLVRAGSAGLPAFEERTRPPLVRADPAALPALREIRPPLVLGTFHVGALHALGPALERLPGPVLALRQGPLYEPRPPVELISTEGDDQSRAAAFQRALAHLAGGGFVALALDVAPGPAIPVPCLGRTLALSRGPFALARLAGTPIAPMAARWRHGRVEVEIGEALGGSDPARTDASAWESALAAAAGRWLERHLLASPGETGLGLLRALLAAGTAPGDPARDGAATG